MILAALCCQLTKWEVTYSWVWKKWYNACGVSVRGAKRRQKWMHRKLTCTSEGFKEHVSMLPSTTSCHCSSPHSSCWVSDVVRLWQGLNHSWGRVSFFGFLLSPLPLYLPQISTSDKLTPKPCFISAPQAADDTSFRWRNMQWVTHYCWWTEGASIYMISHPEAETW